LLGENLKRILGHGDSIERIAPGGETTKGRPGPFEGPLLSGGR
jgi:hypothetical protein